MFVLANCDATCHMYRRSTFIRSKWIPTIPHNAIVIRMNENAWQYLNRGPYKVYPRWAQHILNKNLHEHRVAERSNRVARRSLLLVSRLSWLSALMPMCVGRSFVHSLDAFVPLRPMCVLVGVHSTSRCCAADATWLSFACWYCFFLRLFVYSTHKHSDALVLYILFLYIFASFLCVLNILYWLCYDLMDQREESVATCSSDRQLRKFWIEKTTKMFRRTISFSFN